MRNENLPKKEGGAVPAPSIPAPTEVRERVEWVYIYSSYLYICLSLWKTLSNVPHNEDDPQAQ